MKWIKLFGEYHIDTIIETSDRIFIAFIAQKFIQESNLRKTSVKVKKTSVRWADEELLPLIEIIAGTSTVIARLEMTEDFKYLRITKSGFKLIFNFVNDYGGKYLMRFASERLAGRHVGSVWQISGFKYSPLFQIFLEIINRIMDNLLENELDTKDFLKLKNRDVTFVGEAFEDYVSVASEPGDKYFSLL